MLSIAILTVTVATQPVFLLAAASPQAGPELGFGPIGLGLYTTAFFLAASVASRPAGRLIERIGWPTAMRLTALGAASTLLLIAAFGRSTITLSLLLILAAGFYGFANPAANLALARYVRAGRRGTFFGLKHAGIPGSTLLAGLAVPLINLNVGWRWSYVAAAGVAVLLLLLIPREAPPPQAVQTTPAGVSTVMPVRDMRRLTLVAGLITSAPGALATFTVSAGLAAGLSEAAAGWTLSVAGLSSIVARGVFGSLADRGFHVARLFVGVIAIGAVFMVGLAFGSGPAFVVLSIITFATAWGWPGLLTLLVVTGNSARPAEATAQTQAGVFVGAGLAPPAFGWLVATAGYTIAWISIGVLLAIGAVVASSLARKVHDGV
jgi:MFS family permease